MTGAAPRASLLDALLGPDGTPPRDGLRRDLGLLFGTRPRRRAAPAHLAELRASVLAYGMPDLRAGPAPDEAGGDALAAGIAARIRRFEPRLAEVAVERVEGDGRPRFRIRAVLGTEGGGQPVSYDAVLDAAGRSLTVADPVGR